MTETTGQSLMDRCVVIRETSFSIGSLIGEGFDLPGLCTLFLAMPLSFKGRLIQYAGRLHRESEGKTDVRIYDYVDMALGLGVTMFRKPVTAYKKRGYRLDIPADSRAARLIVKNLNLFGHHLGPVK